MISVECIFEGYQWYNVGNMSHYLLVSACVKVPAGATVLGVVDQVEHQSAFEPMEGEDYVSMV